MEENVKIIEGTEKSDSLKDALPQSPTVLEVENKDEKKDEKKSDKHGIKINAKDYSWLKKNHYEEIRSRFKTTFILQHKKFPEKIVELRASSAVHACSLIHWKPNQVRLIGTKNETPDIVDKIKSFVSGGNEANDSIGKETSNTSFA